MNIKIFEKNLRIIQKQRNIFIFISLLSIGVNIILSIKNLLSDERVILVPGLRQAVWTNRNEVSGSYIEEMSILMLNHLLDISPKNIEYKKSLLLKHVSASDKINIERLQKYFEETEEKYKKFDFTTYFTIKDLEIDIDNLSALARGILTCNYGKRGLSTSNEEYLLKFEFVGGFLKLKSFENILHEEN